MDHRNEQQAVTCSAESASARQPATDVVRYPFEVRWAAERGWLLVRDPVTGEWHQVEARHAPDSWRREASERRGRTGWR